ncbi:hypothetical protein SISNIDRAFT_394583, partial [Sistotremastrum niveocremeum HHB9708]
IESIPSWDGDGDTLVRWIIKVNSLATRSGAIFEELGTHVPYRLKEGAEMWYFSLPENTRLAAQANWGTLRDVICAYYMNRSWLDKQRIRARNSRYREPGHLKETPSEYYIRKAELLTLLFGLSDSEMIMEVMNGAPASWTSILTPHLCTDVLQFQASIKFHEDALM